MSHYQKLATLVLRVVTFVFLMLGMIGLLYQSSVPQTPSPDHTGQVFSSVSFTLFGLVGFFLSPLLGRLLARDL